ncbi:MAG: DMT family transporter [Patescibacteria group bacterium]|nr:DMT family transporter [Patescibacteria group bacterium]
MLSAFLAALGNVADVVQGKYILSKERMPFKAYVTLQNFFIFIVMIVMFYFWGEIDFAAIDTWHYFVLGIIVIIAFAYNYLFAYAMKKGKVCDVEPIAMTYPLLTMILVVTFYPDERNWMILIPALVAGTALAYSRIERHHLKINKYSLAIMGFAILIAIEQNLAKYMLEVFSPVAFYTIRIGFMSTLFLLFVRPSLKKVDLKLSGHVFLNGTIIAIEYVLSYIAIKEIGLVTTSLIMLLAPVLILIISNFLFEEKTTLKKAIADAVILICIATAILIK